MIKRFSLITFFITIAGWLAFAQDDTLEKSIKRGEEVYAANCSSCHMPQGEGLEGVYPPMAKTDYLKDQPRAIDIILKGQDGEVTVNGKTYNVAMEAMPNLTDQQIADVLNYVGNTWENKNPQIKPTQVKAQRK